MNAVDKTPVDLGAVQETLLIPLLGRAHETKKKRGILSDARAVEIVEQLDYDFDKWRNAPSLMGASIRTLMFDRFVTEFLADNPAGTVVELGCGLNTRFDRVDNGSVRWFDLDLPDVIGLRRRFFEDTPRCTMLAASVVDSEWMQAVLATGGPWLFVSEAVLIYLDEADVRRTLEQLAATFPQSSIATDTTDAAMVAGQGRHDAMRHLPRESWFRWECDDPAVVESWVPQLRLDQSLTFVDAGPDIVRRLPWKFRLLVRLAPGLLRRRIRGYRLNLFVPRPT